MSLYESLVGNVGIGMPALMRKWVEDSKKDPSRNINISVGDIIFSKKGISTQCADILNLVTFDDIPEYIKFDEVYQMQMSASKRGQSFPEKFLPNRVGALYISRFDLSDQKITISFDKSLQKNNINHQIPLGDQPLCCLTLTLNKYKNTVVNVEGDDVCLFIERGHDIEIISGITTNVKKLCVETCKHRLGPRKPMTDEEATRLVRLTIPSKCFPNLDTIYVSSGGEYRLNNGIWSYKPFLS